MSDDLLGKLDQVLARKQQEKAIREKDMKESRDRAKARAKGNAELMSSIILPALTEVQTELENRGIACQIRPGDDTDVSFDFNPSGALNHQRGQNAHVQFILGDRRNVSVQICTMYNHGGGQAGGDGSIELDDQLSANIRKKIIEVVLKTVG